MKNMHSNEAPGIFNDVIGPVMRGPSSSHTAAAHRIGSIIRQLGTDRITKVRVRFDKSSALATTYRGQGSAMGLAGGILGLEMTDPEILAFEKHLENSPFNIEYFISDIDNKHPNAYQISVQYQDQEDLDMVALSLGGGTFKVVEWNGFQTSFKGDCFLTLLIVPAHLSKHLPDTATQDSQGNLLLQISSLNRPGKELEGLPGLAQDECQRFDLSPVMPAPSASPLELPFATVEEMLELASAQQLSLSDLALKYESARTGLSPAFILEKMEEMVALVRHSIEEGLKGTRYTDRILGSQSGLISAAEKKGLIAQNINSTIIAYASAIMEVKSSMGVIVAIPTAGSCGVLGAALFAAQQEEELDPAQMSRAFLAAGITGIFIANTYTFSAEEGGCQVETGAASAMAAAGLVELYKGSARQAMDAASMALQNVLGLICDPVAVRVEVPCLGKNIMAASNAYNSSIMALAGFESVIPYQEVIDAMKSVGKAMPASLCCTGLGGLAQSPAGQCLHRTFSI
jgi:L-serine dehydratase